MWRPSTAIQVLPCADKSFKPRGNAVTTTRSNASEHAALLHKPFAYPRPSAWPTLHTTTAGRPPAPAGSPQAGPPPAGAGLRHQRGRASIKRRSQSRSLRERETLPPLPRRHADPQEGAAGRAAVGSHEHGAGCAVGGQRCPLRHLPAVSVAALPCPALPLRQGFRTRPAPASGLSGAAARGAVHAGSRPSVAGRGERVFWQGGKTLVWPRRGRRAARSFWWVESRHRVQSVNEREKKAMRTGGLRAGCSFPTCL